MSGPELCWPGLRGERVAEAVGFENGLGLGQIPELALLVLVLSVRV